jgi:hypothetical protein
VVSKYSFRRWSTVTRVGQDTQILVKPTSLIASGSTVKRSRWVATSLATKCNES